MADEKGVGARGLRGIIEKIMLPLQYELPAQKDVESCTITKDFIDGKGEIELKKAKKTAAKNKKEVN
jgi:ATP-dependent Clp protease ATP-binding subunit ClpX